MNKPQQQLYFYGLMVLIITLLTTIQFTKHKNLKEHIDLNYNHLKDNIN
ncbi:hypothetical protein J8J04_01570 ['Fragaria x ananassa' phyllody phytoplasma]|uniref:Uncharacterized protein n=1 Tax='Fragaria x ananassa' phyllody phytoplasma TaxID=2358428 RepID=A0ABS5K3A4_9MOLU|nr:hypothetical protein ['Fragaria x ananassa' phyllody phytoplasma]MBS2126379.1 hypothetical protein ['Fragaria x ananassa' phyllody phytoplasma]